MNIQDLVDKIYEVHHISVGGRTNNHGLQPGSVYQIGWITTGTAVDNHEIKALEHEKILLDLMLDDIDQRETESSLTITLAQLKELVEEGDVELFKLTKMEF